MIKAILGASGMITGPTFSLLAFFSVLVLTTFWIYRPGSKAVYETISKSILEEGEKHQ